MTQRSILIYGAGGAGKSSRAAEAAAWVYKQSGLHTRVINADPGGTAVAFQALTEEGIAELWHVDQWDEKSIFSTLDLATKGWWPLDPSIPNSPLQPCVREWKACPFCGLDSGAKGFGMVPKCLACGETYQSGMVLPIRRDPINGMEKVGLVVFEGMTSFGELLLRRLKKVDPEGGNVVTDEGFKIASPGKQHYGSAQSYLAQYIANVRLIPSPLVLWTALEIKSDEDGKPLYGPKGPGKALTAVCIPWFTHVLHLDVLPKKQGGVVVKDANGMETTERKFFLSPHFPPDNPAFKFSAKVSLPHGGEGEMPQVIDADMNVFFTEYEKALARAKAKLLG